MARKSKKTQTPAIIPIMYMLLRLTQMIIELIIKLILFIFAIISFYLSGYKKKSGNGFLKTYFDKGYYGEYTLFKKVSKIFNKQNVFTNLYLDNENTDKTEIDVVAVSSEGVYVFEMKNYGGYIYGSDKDKNWTQVFNKHSKFSFYNPLRQNYAHRKALEKLLEISEDKTIPMVVFSNRSKLSKIEVKSNDKVYKINDAIKEIKKIRQQKINLLTKEEMDKFKIELINVSNVSEEIKKKHIEQVIELKNMLQETNQEEQVLE